MSLVAIRTRSSLYTAWKCYKNSYKLDALQMMTEKDWEYEKLSEWIGHNIHQISFDSEGKIYIDESWEYKNKLNQEFFLPDFDKKLGYVR